MNKLELRQTILQLLQEKLSVAHSSAQRAIESATDEETVPEHKYDTLALEASYLAHGQAMRVQESELEIGKIRQMPLPEEPNRVVLGALVTLMDAEDNSSYFFIAPCAGGLKVEYNHNTIMLVTFDSPLGKAMQAKELGDEVSYLVAGKEHWYEIETIL